MSITVTIQLNLIGIKFSIVIYKTKFQETNKSFLVYLIIFVKTYIKKFLKLYDLKKIEFLKSIYLKSLAVLKLKINVYFKIFKIYKNFEFAFAVKLSK